jgi:uncharacterized repeat protein (TIGR01451 family)
MNKFVINNISLLIGVLMFWSSGVLFPSAFADQYGSTPSNSISVDKFVGKPDGNNISYVDNLSVSDYKFSPNSDIYFQIKVKNTSNEKLYNIVVKDFLPEFIDPIEGPGNLDFNNHLITVNAGDFNINEEKIYILKTRVFTTDKLPSDKGLFCETNNAEARNDKVSGSDQAGFCFEKQVNAGTSSNPITPTSGPTQNILIISLTSLMAYAGFKLRKIE